MDQQELGYHKGSLEVLIKERDELLRLVAIVNSLIQAHSKTLQDAGFNIDEFLKQKTKTEEKPEKQNLRENEEFESNFGF